MRLTMAGPLHGCPQECRPKEPSSKVPGCNDGMHTLSLSYQLTRGAAAAHAAALAKGRKQAADSNGAGGCGDRMRGSSSSARCRMRRSCCCRCRCWSRSRPLLTSASRSAAGTSCSRWCTRRCCSSGTRRAGCTALRMHPHQATQASGRCMHAPSWRACRAGCAVQRSMR